jgi:hypothetical protein
MGRAHAFYPTGCLYFNFFFSFCNTNAHTHFIFSKMSESSSYTPSADPAIQAELDAATLAEAIKHASGVYDELIDWPGDVSLPEVPSVLCDMEPLPYEETEAGSNKSVYCSGRVQWWKPHYNKEGRVVSPRLAYVGVETGIFPGWEMNWFRDGTLHVMKEYNDNMCLPSGIVRKWYPGAERQLMQETLVHRSRHISGISRIWHPNGQLEWMINKSTNVTVIRRWDEAGELIFVKN